MRYVLLLILILPNSDPVSEQIRTSTKVACEKAKKELLADLDEAGLKPALLTCVDTGRAV